MSSRNTFTRDYNVIIPIASDINYTLTSVPADQSCLIRWLKLKTNQCFVFTVLGQSFIPPSSSSSVKISALEPFSSPPLVVPYLFNKLEITTDTDTVEYGPTAGLHT